MKIQNLLCLSFYCKSLNIVESEQMLSYQKLHLQIYISLEK